MAILEPADPHIASHRITNQIGVQIHTWCIGYNHDDRSDAVTASGTAQSK
jgi:hypothetical protein